MSHTITEYDDACKLYKNGLNVASVSKATNIPDMTVRMWLKKDVMPREKIRQVKKLTLKKDEFFHYIIGVMKGDGSIRVDRKVGGYVSLTSIDKDFVQYFQRTLEKWSNLKVPIYTYEKNQKPLYMACLSSVFVAEFLKAEMQNDAEVNIDFLKGFFDSEGCVSYNWKYKEREHGQYVAFSNYDLNLIQKIQRFLDLKGVKSHIHITVKKGTLHKMNNQTFVTRGDCYALFIRNRSGVQWFAENVGCRIRRKQEKLIEGLKNNWVGG
jgi:intein-encoded DNA endonuclease-like protein